jgi:hypothetical protein
MGLWGDSVSLCVMVLYGVVGRQCVLVCHGAVWGCGATVCPCVTVLYGVVGRRCVLVCHGAVWGCGATLCPCVSWCCMGLWGNGVPQCKMVLTVARQCHLPTTI